MQELLGRIAALDPEASLGIRIIACFDELIAGNVNTRGQVSNIRINRVGRRGY